MFIDDNMKDELNTSNTENGALGFATTKSNLIDFNFKIASYRSETDDKIIVDFKKAWYENKELALKYLFYVRDVREGLGERRLFRLCINEISDSLDERVFDWIVEYGRYDDLFILITTKLKKPLIKYIKNQLKQDWTNMLDNKPISLLAKWMPSINASSENTKKLAKTLIIELNKLSSNDNVKINEKHYRKMLSTLRKYLDVTEVKCCANEWDEIKYEAVPSQANLRYKDAFLKHDEVRRTEYLEKLEKGETKINADTLFPHDIVNKYVKYNSLRVNKDTTLEELWKSLPDFVNEESQTLVVRDGSCSMCSNIGNTSISALDVSTALAVYFSERCKGQFKDNFITFSNRPKLVSLSKYGNLHDKLKLIYNENECSNTDIEATFDLVLKVAVKNNLKQEDIPNLLIISDMEFDIAHTDNNNIKLFEHISNKYNEVGYKLPKLIFWNVNSRTNTIPITQNENGVILVSGFSPTICKIVLNGETDPYKALIKEITSERYSQVTLNK